MVRSSSMGPIVSQIVRCLYYPRPAYAFSGTVVGVELYDYQTDPNESRNLAEALDYNKVPNRMVKLFDEVLPHLPARR